MSRYQNLSTQEQIYEDSYNVLTRTGESIQRSNQMASETEQIGTEILSDLSEQRESLLRSTRRLQDADDHLTKSQRIIRRLRREVIYNRVILIIIIILEILILTGLLVLKFVHF